MKAKSLKPRAGGRGWWSRRSLLIGLVSLGTWLSLKRPGPAEKDADKTVLAGGWLLKKSDLS